MNEIDKINKEVLDNILNLKNSRNLSDAKFCSEFGLNPKTFDNWKRGKSKSFMKMLEIIACYFDVSVDYLLGNEQKIKLLTEREKLNQENLNIMNSLPDDLYKVAHEQLKSLAALANKNKTK
jgi:transcriptional regulator with XRE-family HTH domain